MLQTTLAAAKSMNLIVVSIGNMVLSLVYKGCRKIFTNIVKETKKVLLLFDLSTCSFFLNLN